MAISLSISIYLPMYMCALIYLITVPLEPSTICLECRNFLIDVLIDVMYTMQYLCKIMYKLILE